MTGRDHEVDDVVGSGRADGDGSGRGNKERGPRVFGVGSGVSVMTEECDPKLWGRQG
jgi:hypothetical protein